VLSEMEEIGQWRRLLACVMGWVLLFRTILWSRTCRWILDGSELANFSFVDGVGERIEKGLQSVWVLVL